MGAAKNSVIELFPKDRERFLDTTLNALPCLVSYIDSNFHYQYVNSAYENWFGVQSQSCIGKHASVVVGEETFSIARPFFEAALEGRSQKFVREMPYKSGGTRTVEVSYIPDARIDGSVSGIYVIVQDLTSLHDAQKKAQDAQSDLQNIVDHLPAMIGYWNRDLVNVHANTVYATYFGKTPAQILGRHISELLGPELYEKNLPHLNACLAGEAQNFEREIPIENGEVRTTLANYIPDFRNGVVAGIFVIVSDISEVKKLNQQKRAYESQLISSAKMSSLGEMAGGIAHEINNPLAIIAGRIDQLKAMIASGTFDATRMSEMTSKIEATVFRISKIVNSLRAFARSADHEPFSLNSVSKIVEDTLEFCLERFKNDEVELRVDRVAVDIAIECRPIQIGQVLLNLLNNAHDAVESQNVEDRWVALDFKDCGNEVEIAVTDSGAGLSADSAARVFQPFFSTKPVGKGTGLGLSVSKGIADSHRGSLRYDAKNKNTRFVLRLPKSQSAHQQSQKLK